MWVPMRGALGAEVALDVGTLPDHLGVDRPAGPMALARHLLLLLLLLPPPCMLPVSSTMSHKVSSTPVSLHQARPRHWAHSRGSWAAGLSSFLLGPDPACSVPAPSMPHHCGPAPLQAKSPSVLLPPAPRLAPGLASKYQQGEPTPTTVLWAPSDFLSW